MKIEIIKCLEDNFSYLLIDEVTKSAIVVDPSDPRQREANAVARLTSRARLGGTHNLLSHSL